MSSHVTAPKVVLIAAFIQLLIFYGHWLLYWTIVFSFLPGPQAAFWLKVVLTCLSLSFLVFHVLIAFAQNRILGWLDKISSIWMGTVHILVFACIPFWIIAYIFAANRVLPPWPALGVVLFAMALITSIYGVVQSFRPHITRYHLRLPNLPQAWRGRKAILVSDVHTGSVFGRRDVEKLVRMINAEKPDIVFIPGDFFNGPPADYVALAAPLADIQAPHGTYFIEGNHEEFRDPTQYLEALRFAGVKIWNNKVTLLEGVQILGLPYAGSNRPEELRTALSGLSFDRKQPSILLKHSPSAAATVAEAGISLMLSGHTHKGQIWPYTLIVRHRFGKAGYGHSEINGMQVITTSGFGDWGPPQRLGTKAEMVVIRFSSDSPDSSQE